MFIARKPGLKYVHRTGVGDYDYDVTTLTQDGAWHVLDLSAIVPASAKLVLLRLAAAHGLKGKCFRVCKAGESNIYACANVVTQVADVINEQTALVDCSGQQIQYWATINVPYPFTLLWLVVLGWFL